MQSFLAEHNHGLMFQEKHKPEKTLNQIINDAILEKQKHEATKNYMATVMAQDVGKVNSCSVCYSKSGLIENAKESTLICRDCGSSIPYIQFDTNVFQSITVNGDVPYKTSNRNYSNSIQASVVGNSALARKIRTIDRKYQSNDQKQAKRVYNFSQIMQGVLPDNYKKVIDQATRMATEATLNMVMRQDNLRSFLVICLSSAAQMIQRQENNYDDFSSDPLVIASYFNFKNGPNAAVRTGMHMMNKIMISSQLDDERFAGFRKIINEWKENESEVAILTTKDMCGKETYNIETTKATLAGHLKTDDRLNGKVGNTITNLADYIIWCHQRHINKEPKPSTEEIKKKYKNKDAAVLACFQGPNALTKKDIKEFLKVSIRY